ncbi:hypothetical protein MASR2M78_19670 [Treponema sp.]
MRKNRLLEYTDSMKLKLLGHSANDLFWFILPLVMPVLLMKYELSYTQAGGILTIYLSIIALGSFVLGKLSDSVSSRYILSYGFLLASMGLIASGFAPNLPIFLILISITAVGVSTFHPVMYALIDEAYPTNKGRVMGLYESFGTAAILLMFLANGLLFAWIGVRGIMILSALPALIMAYLYHSPKHFQINPKIKGAPKKVLEKAKRHDIFIFVAFLLSVILRVFSVTAILNFLPTIFANFLGFTGSTAAYATAFFFAGSIVGALLVGNFSDRWNNILILLVGTLLIIVSLFILSLSLPKLVFPLVIALFGAFTSGCIINQNLLMTNLGRHLGKGEVFGILMGVMTLTSSLSPAFFGFLLDHLTFSSSLRLMSIPLLCSMLILAFLSRSGKKGIRS